MAHEIESRNGKAAMAYNVQRGLPWHGLGTPLDGDADVDTMLKAADLDWEVNLEPVMRNGAPVEGKFFSVRSDDDKVFDVVGAQYEDLGNREMLEWGLDIVKQAAGADLNVGLDTAMSLRGGKIVVANIVIPSAFSVLGDDAHDLNLGVYTAHDGSKSLGADISAIRRVCMNTHQMAMSAAKSSVRIRHTRTMQDRMGQAAKVLGLALDYGKQYAKIMEQFATEEFNEKMVDEFLETLFPAEAPKALPDGKMQGLRGYNIATKQREGVKANLLHSETIPSDLRFTKFGVFNATTEWVDHLRDFRTDKRIDRKEQIALAQMPGGTAHALKNKAFALLG